jgi:hypothetical protein
MLASLIRFLTRSRPSTQRTKPKARIVPSLEALEERWLPSTTAGVNALLDTVAASSTAAQTQQAAATFSSFTTGGSQTQSLAQFNPALGTLNSVQIVFNGTLNSDVKVENLDAAPATVNAQVNGNLSLQGPGGTTLLSLTPAIRDNSTSLSAFDGTLDYGGTSGHDFGLQSASAQKSITLTNNLSAFEGGGNVSFTESAQSSSTVSGSGNEQVHISSAAAGGVTVIYHYTPTPPPAPPAAPPPAPPPVSPPASPPPCNDGTPPSGPASIEGIVYVDSGNSGQYQASDPAAKNVTVTLTGVTLTQQTVTQTATTAADGSYSFTGLLPGIYSLNDLPVPSQYSAGAATLGSYGGQVSNGQLLLALPQGGDAMNYDFGLVPIPPPAAPPPATSPGAGQSPPPAAPPPAAPPASPAPADPGGAFNPALGLSKRSLIGDGWQSLG